MTSKLAALHAQHLERPGRAEAVNDIESLTADLSRKIWQKISILAMADQRDDAVTASGPIKKRQADVHAVIDVRMVVVEFLVWCVDAGLRQALRQDARAVVDVVLVAPAAVDVDAAQATSDSSHSARTRLIGSCAATLPALVRCARRFPG